MGKRGVNRARDDCHLTKPQQRATFLAYITQMGVQEP